MVNNTVYKSKQVNSINTITCEIEDIGNTVVSLFSIIVYDNEGGVFIEKFADTYTSAKNKADKLFDKIINQY